MNERETILCETNRLRVSTIRKSKGLENDVGEPGTGSLEELLFNNQRLYRQRFHPYLYRLADVEWAVFGTFTWKAPSRRRDTWKAEELRRHDFRDFLGALCGRLKLKRKHLALYHTMEWGAAQECHFHFLIARGAFKPESDAELAQTIQDLWTKDFEPFDSKVAGAGTAVVVPYDKAKEHPAVEYCLKREFDSFGSPRERLDFISPALMRLLLRKVQEGGVLSKN